MVETKLKILIVDDSKSNLAMVERVLAKENFETFAADSGTVCIEQARLHRPDLILLDVIMPGINGYETCQILKQEEYTKNIPVIFLTGQTDVNDLQEAFNAGGVDFITKPFRILELLSRVRTHLQIKIMQKNLESIVDQRTMELQKALLKLESSSFEILRRLSQAAEFRDNETADHLHRMSRYSVILGRELGFDDKKCHMLLYASMMHDAGKIGIPDNILLKPGKLTVEEFDIMKRHPEIGYKLLSDTESELLQMAATIAYTHHEKFDGSGYPNGIIGTAIPLEGRIVALADVFDALSTARPYKEAWPMEQVIEHINKFSGSHFDPKIVGVFNKKIANFLEIKNTFNH